MAVDASEGVVTGTPRVVINEIFGPTVQGEGSGLGLPAIFLRVAGCSLSCSWCDTAYSWDWSRFDRDANSRHVLSDEAWDEVRSLASGTLARTLVLTGGEPALQSRGLLPVARSAKSSEWRVEIETAGAVDLGTLADVVDVITVSPKLASSGMSTDARIKEPVLASLTARSNTVWKLVINDEADLVEADRLIRQFQPHEVFLMPQATTAEEVLDRLRWLVPAAIERGHRVSPRLHTLLWGDERGR